MHFGKQHAAAVPHWAWLRRLGHGLPWLATALVVLVLVRPTLPLHLQEAVQTAYQNQVSELQASSAAQLSQARSECAANLAKAQSDYAAQVAQLQAQLASKVRTMALG